MSTNDPILMVVDDLMFRLRIEEVARSLGIEVIASEAIHARDRAKADHVRGVVLDLNLISAPALQVIEELRGVAELQEVPILGFFAHLDQHLAEAARRAGATETLTRSRFNTRLVEILQGLGAG